MSAACAEVRKRLASIGMLMLQDRRLPSVVGCFVDSPPSTSWWNIPQAHDIFACLQTLERHAVATRLVNEKVTYVHDRLWPALVTVGASGETWQTSGLSLEAKRLLESTTQGNAPIASGKTARELQVRLSVVAQEVHTPAGRHELHLETWDRWATRFAVTRVSSLVEAKRLLEEAAVQLGASPSALPW
jgi:hypothetical protein